MSRLLLFVGSIRYRPILLHSPPSHSPCIQLVSFFPPFRPICTHSFSVFTPLSLTPYHQLLSFPTCLLLQQLNVFTLLSPNFRQNLKTLSPNFHNTFITRSSHSLLTQRWIILPSTPIVLLSHYHAVKVP